MNEKMNKAVELGDEDLGKVSGGTAMFTREEQGKEYRYLCNHPLINSEDVFKQYIASGNCPRYVVMPGKNKDNTCGTCDFYLRTPVHNTRVG